ncbi:MAG: hypothetical protein CME81_02865 [Halomonas sp.]|nr:hypothetical protein [Halomonas sp.]
MVLLLALVVNGCGQKGPLYRDSQDASRASGTGSAGQPQDRKADRD